MSRPSSSDLAPVRPGAPVRDVLFRLALDLHAAGASAARLETALGRAARRLGVPLQVLGTPTSLIVDFGPEHGGVRMARVEPGDPDLARLARVDAILERLEEGELTGEEALLAVEAGAGAPSRVPPLLDLAAIAVASGSATAFFGGGWLDAGVAAALASAIGGVGSLFARSEDRRPLFEPLAALLAAAVATALARLGAPVESLAVTLGAVIALVPGYSLTVALSELAARHLVAGTARLAGTLGVLLGMGLGVGIGQALGALVPAGEAAAPRPFGDGAVWVVVVLAALCFSVLFRARPRDVPSIVAATLLAFVGARLGGAWLGPELGAFVGALALGLSANAVARATRRPASTVLTPGIMVLVPGSIGFRAVALLLQADTLTGVELAFDAALVGSSLVGGLLAANLLLTPRRSL